VPSEGQLSRRVPGKRHQGLRFRRALLAHESHSFKTQHGGLIAYGNDAAGRWSMMPSLADPNRIAEAVTHGISVKP
jgi:hypothetical protein